MPRHQRRLQSLKAKRGNEKHFDFICTLENLKSVSESKMMTSDDMIIYLFAEKNHYTMSRLALKILVAELRTKVTETENSIWCKSGKNYGKMAHWEKICQNYKTKTALKWS